MEFLVRSTEVHTVWQLRDFSFTSSYTVGEYIEFTLTEFRQINYLVIHLVKTSKRYFHEIFAKKA